MSGRRRPRGMPWPRWVDYALPIGAAIAGAKRKSYAGRKGSAAAPAKASRYSESKKVTGYKFDARTGGRSYKIKSIKTKKKTIKSRVKKLEEKMVSAQIAFKVKDYAVTTTACVANGLEGGVVRPWNPAVMNTDLATAPDGVGGSIDLGVSGANFAPYVKCWSQVNFRNNYNQRVQVDCYSVQYKKGADGTNAFNMWKIMVNDATSPTQAYNDLLVLNGYPTDHKAFKDQFLIKEHQRAFLDPGDEMIQKYSNSFRHDINADITNAINREVEETFEFFYLIRGTHAHTDTGDLCTTAAQVDIETKTIREYFYDGSGSGQFIRYLNTVTDPGLNVVETYGPSVEQNTGLQ